MIRPVSLFRVARSAGMLLALAGLASAQEGSVILKSLDQLEKRVSRIEAEMGRIRKSGPAPAAPAAARPDTASAALAARLDSVSARLARLEQAPAPAAASTATGTGSSATASPATSSPSSASASAASAAPSPEKDSIAVLIREVRALTVALKSGALASAPAHASKTEPAPAARPAAPAPSVAVAASAAAPAAGLSLKGDIQIQGERKFTSQSNRDNLDDFWGRLNFGAEYDDGNFQSKVNIRIFPEGFGFEPLTGATFDTVGQGSLKVQSQPSPRMVINHAWVRYSVGCAKVRFGRFETVETKSDNFGNYVDLGPTASS